MTYFKRVDAQQLNLTEEQHESLKTNKPVDFMGFPVKQYGASYFCIMNAGENQVKVEATQWVVRHPEGHYEILWPEQFDKYFQSSEFDEPPLKVNDPFLKKSFNQPTAII